MTAILWRRLETPGHDACRLRPRGEGWELEGRAVFLEDGRPTVLDYRVHANRRWETERGSVRGWRGPDPVECVIERSRAGSWTLDGVAVAGLDGCRDLDFGFTPATNTLQLQRAALAPGEAADVPVAWFDLSAAGLSRLEQRYERRGPDAYWYRAPRFDYEALIEVRPDGFVRTYPGLWVEEAGAAPAGT